MLRRTYGLAIDSVVEHEVVLPPRKSEGESRMIKANKDSYSDLFWALRGGGNQMFGFITAITYRLVVVSCVVCLYS